MSSIDRTPAGTWQARWRDAAGRQHKKNFDLKRDAVDFLDRVGADTQRGEYIDPRLSSSPFEDWGEKWLRTTVKLAPTTRRGYEQLYRLHVRPYFAGRRLGSIDYADVEAFIAKKLGDEHSPHQIRNMVSVISLIMKVAIRSNARRDNPAADHSIPDRSRRRKRQGINIPTMEEIKRLVAHVPIERYVPAVWLLVYAGLRPSELCGLRVRSVDFIRSAVHIDTTLTPVNKLEGESYQLWEGPPKTLAGDRTVPIPRWLTDDLAAMLADRKERLGRGAEHEDWLFLSYREDKPLNRDKFRTQVIRPALDAAGLPRSIRTYDLRHAHASLLIEQGANLLEIAHRMGHTDPGVTLKIYGHLMRDRQDELTEKLDKLFGGHGRDTADATTDNTVRDLDEYRADEG